MIEPRISLQWFVRTGPLAKAAIEVVREGRVAIIPGRFVKIYFDWLENIRDWCISRQLWWGHRIPVWYCQDCAKAIASVDEPAACVHCGSKEIIQDPDVLDTWFSSALWPHSTLGWPEDTGDLRYFYPGSVMETGYDILFFWVARMIMMGLQDTGEVPFHTVYLHGLIRDESGEKMSKLRGNVINPAEAIGKYGVDALRFALTTGSSPGNDINVGESRLESGRNFVNKLWNATRFILQRIDAETLESQPPNLQPQSIEDQWISSQLNRLIKIVTELMDDFQFGEAEQQIYDFVWSRFCDWYIEIAKIRLQSQSEPSPLPFLVDTLEKSLRLLHPYMPFVTEELWQNLKYRLPDGNQMPASIVIGSYPLVDDKAFVPEAERVMDSAIEIVRSIRNVRAQHKVKPNKWIQARVYTGDLLSSLVPQTNTIEVLAKARPVAILDRQKRESPKDTDLVLVLKEAEVVVPLAGMVDRIAEEQRLLKESREIKERMSQLEARLGDKEFVSKAPSQVVEKEKQKLCVLEDKLNRLNQELSQLNS